MIAGGGCVVALNGTAYRKIMPMALVCLVRRERDSRLEKRITKPRHSEKHGERGEAAFRSEAGFHARVDSEYLRARNARTRENYAYEKIAGYRPSLIAIEEHTVATAL